MTKAGPAKGPYAANDGDGEVRRLRTLKLALLATLLTTAWAPPASAQMSTGVTSPAFDSKVYNPDAVAQSRKDFGHWTLVCADIQGLNRRFCNVTSLASAPDGKFFVAIVVSTTDDGKPAAILRMPLLVSLREGVEVATSAASAAKTKTKLAKAANRRVDFVNCEQQLCTSILPLAPTDLAALVGRGHMNLRVHVLVNDASIQTASLLPTSKPLDVVFDGTGFAEALQASQKP